MHSCWCILLIECGLNSNFYLNSNLFELGIEKIRNRKENQTQYEAQTRPAFPADQTHSSLSLPVGPVHPSSFFFPLGPTHTLAQLAPAHPRPTARSPPLALQPLPHRASGPPASAAARAPRLSPAPPATWARTSASLRSPPAHRPSPLAAARAHLSVPSPSFISRPRRVRPGIAAVIPGDHLPSPAPRS